MIIITVMLVLICFVYCIDADLIVTIFIVIIVYFTDYECHQYSTDIIMLTIIATIII